MFTKTAVFTTAVACALLLAACSNGSDTRLADDFAPQGTPFLVAKPEDLQGGHTVSAAPADTSPDYNFNWDLIAGQNKLAGNVTVDLGNTDLKVTYTCASGWTMSQAHLYVGTSTPNSNGAPGQFPFKRSFNPAVGTTTFIVPLTSLGSVEDCGQVVYLATHATVRKNNGVSETAWGGKWNNGTPTYEYGWANKWGGYFSSVLLPSPLLPPGQVWYNATHYGNHSYWGINFEDSAAHPFPSGNWSVNPAGNQWVGWCADRLHYMYANFSYMVSLASSCSESLGPVAHNGNWDKVNYLVSQRNKAQGIYAEDWNKPANMDAFEQAIWWYSDGVSPTATLAQRIVQDADANGDNFVPREGDHYVVILVPDTSSDDQKIRAQMNVIELACSGDDH